MKYYVFLLIIVLAFFVSCSPQQINTVKNIQADVFDVPVYEETFAGSGVYVEIDRSVQEKKDSVIVETHLNHVNSSNLISSSDIYFLDDVDSAYFVVMD